MHLCMYACTDTIHRVHMCKGRDKSRPYVYSINISNVMHGHDSSCPPM